MSEDLAPHDQAVKAVVDFDRAVHDPNRTVDPVGALFRALGAASAQHAQEMRAARIAWRNRPEVKARRSVAAEKAAATRAAKKAAELAAQQAEAERDAPVPKVRCPHMELRAVRQWRDGVRSGAGAPRRGPRGPRRPHVAVRRLQRGRLW
ncbi:hypothetical protein [Streptomyces sp. Root369]|uniref:hypothetical protein n=1 Tax=Streptomyces sp. Root369 TaxID=1736523 RepID=UPI000A613A51|nr:hypothetical protein [Streptomyces sp. Root369]